MSTPGFSAPAVPASRERSLAIFGQTMGLVAITCLFAAAGAYIGRDLGGLWFLLPWVLALGCIIGLNVANAKGKTQLALVLLPLGGLEAMNMQRSGFNERQKAGANRNIVPIFEQACKK